MSEQRDRLAALEDFASRLHHDRCVHDNAGGRFCYNLALIFESRFLRAAGVTPAAAVPPPLDVALLALDVEIARRRSPEYRRLPKSSDQQAPATRVGTAAARAMQHGEITGLLLARHLLAAEYDRLRARDGAG